MYSSVWLILALTLTLAPLPPISACDSSQSNFTSPVGCGLIWRYWVQDGAVSTDVLRADLQAIADVGSSGIELISYQSYGFQPPNDIGQLGYGSTTFKHTIEMTAQLASQYNLTMDIAAGPSQGAGIPTQNPDVEGYNTELVFGYIVVKQNQSYTGSLPSPHIFPVMKYGGAVAPAFNITTYQLQAIFLASIDPSSPPTPIINLTTPSTVILNFTSMLNLNPNVTGNTISISNVSTDSIILAFYSRRTGYQEAYGSYTGPDPTLPASWGAYIVDHFSPEGANRIDNFTSSYLFNPVSPALSQVGRLIWEDSMEFRAQLFWTHNFLSRFKTLRGYDAISVGALPAFYSRTLAPFGGDNLPQQLFVFTNDTFNQQFAWDYCDTLSVLYMDYISTRNMNARKLGMKLSLQPGYGFSVDIAAAAGVVDVPEIESLGFTTVDTCRQVSGGVHLGGAPILSTELGAVQLQAYSQKMVDLLKLCYIQFAGGVNRMVWHGFPHNGYVPLTTWPGLTTFSFVYSEMHGPRQPGWSQYRGYMSHLSRTQYILQKGLTGYVDIAIYRHGFNIASSPVFDSSVLQTAGYTYEYISPYNLELPLATIRNGTNPSRVVLGPPRYKVLIINNQHTMVASAATKILSYAQLGLPIVIIGPVPNNVPGYDPANVQKNAVVSAMNTLVTLPNVRLVTGYDGVLAALTALAVRPAASLRLLNAAGSTDKMYSVRRSESIIDNTNIAIDYYWLYNSGTNPVNVSMTFETWGISAFPFALDTWTGEIRAIEMSVSASRVSATLIQLDGIYLESQQTILLAFTNGTQFEGVSIPTSTNNVTTIPITLVNGPLTRGGLIPSLSPTTSTAPTNIRLGNWTLSVTAFQPPSNLSMFASVLTPRGPYSLGDTLTSWNMIPGLAHTSGVGVYSTVFNYPNIDPANMVTILDCSSAAIGVTDHTVIVSLNGVVASRAIDPSRGQVILPSSLLVRGPNQLSISIATTLLNALNLVPPTDILALGGNRLSGVPFVPPDVIHGIQGNITLTLVPVELLNPSNNPSNNTGVPTPTSTPTTTPTPTPTPTHTSSSPPLSLGWCVLSVVGGVILSFFTHVGLFW